MLNFQIPLASTAAMLRFPDAVLTLAEALELSLSHTSLRDLSPRGAVLSRFEAKQEPPAAAALGGNAPGAAGVSSYTAIFAVFGDKATLSRYHRAYAAEETKNVPRVRVSSSDGRSSSFSAPALPQPLRCFANGGKTFLQQAINACSHLLVGEASALYRLAELVSFYVFLFPPSPPAAPTTSKHLPIADEERFDAAFDMKVVQLASRVLPSQLAPLLSAMTEASNADKKVRVSFGLDVFPTPTSVRSFNVEQQAAGAGSCGCRRRRRRRQRRPTYSPIRFISPPALAPRRPSRSS